MKLLKHLPLLIVLFLSSFGIASETSSEEAKKKVLFVNSYHKGYLWSDNIEKALFQTLNIIDKPDGSLDSSHSNVTLKVFRMDTKLNQSEAFMTQAALTAKTLIDEWQPDVVIACDDNASKYLIAPYYKDASLPFVFCGVNWDASVYGFPTNNITGMIEVMPYRHNIGLLKQYAKGSRVGYIGSNTFSERKNIDYVRDKENIVFDDGKLVDTFDEWKKEYLRLQSSVDMLVWFNPIGIRGWDNTEAIAYIQENTRIPTGTTSDHEIIYALIGTAKLAAEQGIWSGRAALRILAGEPPSSIPVTRNRHTQVYVNQKLAQKLNITFTNELLSRAKVVK